MREQDSDHELADPLLPWFVNRTLSRAEHDRVERHAAGCDECSGNTPEVQTVKAVALQMPIRRRQ